MFVTKKRKKKSDQIMYRESPGKWTREKRHYLIYEVEIKELAILQNNADLVYPLPFLSIQESVSKSSAPISFSGYREGCDLDGKRVER